MLDVYRLGLGLHLLLSLNMMSSEVALPLTILNLLYDCEILRKMLNVI